MMNCEKSRWLLVLLVAVLNSTVLAEDRIVNEQVKANDTGRSFKWNPLCKDSPYDMILNVDNTDTKVFKVPSASATADGGENWTVTFEDARNADFKKPIPSAEPKEDGKPYKPKFSGEFERKGGGGKKGNGGGVPIWNLVGEYDVLKITIIEPVVDHNNTYLDQPNYNSSGPITFRAKVEGVNYAGNIDWKVLIEYRTDGGGPYTNNSQFSSPNNTAVNHTFTSNGGRLTITASATVAGTKCSNQITNYITGVGIPNTTITQRLRSLYTPPAGGTAGLLTGVAMKESTYRQFFNSHTKYGLIARWPVENISIYPLPGSYIGMMQVPVKMDTAWDWRVNTQTGANIIEEKLATTMREVANLRATHSGLPNLTGVQSENYALGFYGGYSTRYYTPAKNGAQWIWQTTTRQDLLDYVSYIRNHIQ